MIFKTREDEKGDKENTGGSTKKEKTVPFKPHKLGDRIKSSLASTVHGIMNKFKKSSSDISIGDQHHQVGCFPLVFVCSQLHILK